MRPSYLALSSGASSPQLPHLISMLGENVGDSTLPSNARLIYVRLLARRAPMRPAVRRSPDLRTGLSHQTAPIVNDGIDETMIFCATARIPDCRYEISKSIVFFMAIVASSDCVRFSSRTTGSVVPMIPISPVSRLYWLTAPTNDSASKFRVPHSVTRTRSEHSWSCEKVGPIVGAIASARVPSG